MPSERDKMLAGTLYGPLDPELGAGRERARTPSCGAKRSMASRNPCRVIREITE